MVFELTDLKADLLEQINIRRSFSLFCFQSTDKELNPLIKQFKLKKRLQKICNHLMVQSQSTSLRLNPEFTKELAKLVDCRIDVIRKNLKELYDFGILIRRPVTFNGVELKNGVCYQLNSRNELQIILNDRELNSDGLRGGRFKETTESVKTSLEMRAFSPQDLNTDEFAPPGLIIHENILPTISFAMAPRARSGKKQIRKKYHVQVGKQKMEFLLEASSTDQVATQQALFTYIHLIRMSIAYNIKMLKTGKFKVPFENPTVPYHIADIARVRGLKDGGTQRERINNHIEELYKTQYHNFRLDDELITPDILESLPFSTKHFQYIASYETNSDIAPTVTQSKVKSNPIIYFIDFPVKTIEWLKEQSSFFTIPTRVAEDDPLIFSLYMTLRELKASINSFTLKELKAKMFFDGSDSQLKLSLKEELNKSYRNKGSNSEEFDYNLCGYYLRFSKDQNDQLVLYVNCNHEEMIKTSGALYNGSIGLKNAPTIRNPFKDFTGSKEQLIETNREQSAKNIIINDFISAETRRLKFYHVLRFKVGDYALTAYDNDTHLHHLSILVSNESNLSQEYSYKALLLIRNELSPLKFADKVVGSLDIKAVKEYLENEHQAHLTVVDILGQARNYRERMISIWLDGEISVIAEDILKKFTENTDNLTLEGNE